MLGAFHEKSKSGKASQYSIIQVFLVKMKVFLTKFEVDLVCFMVKHQNVLVATAAALHKKS